jgi:hypothetical protein
MFSLLVKLLTRKIGSLRGMVMVEYGQRSVSDSARGSNVPFRLPDEINDLFQQEIAR